MNLPDNAANRFGSAAFATESDIAHAGLLKQQPGSVLIGFSGKRPLWHHGAGGCLLVAGARGGKLRDILGYNVCSGILTHNVVVLDMKGECAFISQDQSADNKRTVFWNPLGLHGLSQHRINPVDFIRIDSPSLVADIKVFCENIVPLSGAAQGVYFERRAREFVEAIALTLVQINGVLTLGDLFRVINLIPGGGDAWLDFAFEMQESGFELAKRVEEEIAASRENPSNGFQGIIGEVFKAFSALSDPVLLKSVSPPFDFSFSGLVTSERRYQVYLCPPAEFIDAWSPVIKAMFVAGMIYKARSPSAERQTWILDECAQLGAFPLVTKLFTYGAGIGIRPMAVYQSTDQMRATGPSADTIITSSAACRIYFAVRDIGSAAAISHMLGAQTLTYDDDRLQARAAHAKHQAAQALINGGDPFAAGLNYFHHKQEAERPSKQHRQLQTPDEVLNAPPNKAYLFTDALQNPIYADRRAYYEQRWMRGRYRKNPYHR